LPGLTISTVEVSAEALRLRTALVTAASPGGRTLEIDAVSAVRVPY
jgi:hypothetical protein